MDEHMDINGIHEIMQTPSKFHVPDSNHEAHIQDTVHENNERNYTAKQPLNDMDLYHNDNLMHENDSLMNEIFNNPEEEIIFNYLANQFYMAVYFLFGIYYFLFCICYIIFLFYCYFIEQTYVYLSRL